MPAIADQVSALEHDHSDALAKIESQNRSLETLTLSLAAITKEKLALEARIVAVADYFDALTHERPYRGAQSESKTLDAINETSATHFDPVVVEALSRIDRQSGFDSVAD